MHRKREFLSTIKPLFVFSSCLSLSFFTLKNGRIIVSKSKVFSSIFMFILCVILKFLRIYWYNLPDYELLVINLTTYMFVGFCLISYLNCLAYGKPIAKLWNEIIPLVGFITEEAFYRTTFRAVYLYLIGFNVSYITFLIFYYYFVSLGEEDAIYYLAGFADYCMLMHFWVMGTLFSGGLFFGTKLISVANEELEKLKMIESYKNCKSWEGIYFFKVEKVRNLKSQLKMIKHDDLSPLMDIYDKLCGCFENLNDCFGISVTVSCLYSLTEMTLSCYFMVKHGWTATKVFSFWLICCFVNEWVLLHACEKFVKETQKSRHLVQQIVSDNSSQSLKDAVGRFSRYLLHRQVNFTACRLFDLDYQLLYTVMTNIITYLVIVLQFDSSKKDETIL